MSPLTVLSSCFCSSFLWLCAFLLWAITLWSLSDGPAPVQEPAGLPHLDKVLHFGYFFGGAILLSAVLFLWNRRPSPEPSRRTSRWLACIVVVVLAAIGALDEWHQSWIPGRSGNDLGDWTADLLGACVGVFLFQRLHRLLPTRSEPAR
ncbi:MAG: hypothetical protein CMO40_07035 [Verrucomicrobiaceae bacterium]|nr:hypothetical protein [Verrucomicrobiaceae bacterium]